MGSNNNSGGEGTGKKWKQEWLEKDTERCGAKTSSGKPCQRFRLVGKKRCSLHGGRAPYRTTEPGVAATRVANVRNGLVLSPETLELLREPGFVPDSAFAKMFCVGKGEEEFAEYFFGAVEKDFSVVDRTQLFFAGQMAIMILRGLEASKNSKKAWDFSRMLDSFNRAMRELDLTRNARSSLKGQTRTVDIMVLIQQFNQLQNLGDENSAKEFIEVKKDGNKVVY